MKKEKIRNSQTRHKWNAYVSGSKTLVDMFVSNKLQFNGKLRQHDGDLTTWSVDTDFVFESPELESQQPNSDSEDLSEMLEVASPTRVNVYGSPRRSPRIAAASRDSRFGRQATTPVAAARNLGLDESHAESLESGMGAGEMIAPGQQRTAQHPGQLGKIGGGGGGAAMSILPLLTFIDDFQSTGWLLML